MKSLKNKLLAILCIIMVSIQFANIPVLAVDGESTDNSRQVINFNGDWKFYKGSNDNAADASLDDSSWESISLPHTWNGGNGTSLGDGEDGGGDYYRGDGWYRKTITVGNEYENKKVYIKFLGANMKADVYVNGELSGTHKGGYEAFVFDITDKLTANSDNVIAVKVNNESAADIAPLSADYTFFGGIYRNAYLIVTDEVHIGKNDNNVDNGSNGLYLETSNVSKESANLTVRATITNDSSEDKNVTVTATLKNPDADSVNWVASIDEYATFDKESMTPGGDIETVEDTVTIAAGETYDFSKLITVNNPHLWNGRQDPYRYQVEIDVKVDGTVVDNLSDFVGFRYFNVDSENGFFLNGESYPLRGVSRHQDRENLGWAISEKEHDEDLGLIYEMGANSIRLAHYPQDPYFYDLCDKYGIIVWSEIPFVNNIGGTGSYEEPDEERESFFNITKQQLTEMILQNYNHPSICFWGIENEVQDNTGAMAKFTNELYNLAKDLDSTGRLITQALLSTVSGEDWKSDLVSANIYPGWYNGKAEDFGATMDEKHEKESRPIGVSEYGAGANINHHADNPTSISNVGTFDSLYYEEYQSYCHEIYLAAINARPYLWCTYVWNMFDFSADSRSEGGQVGLNDKGLVTRDRKTKKDAFYFYKANWNENDKFAYITSKRYTPRETSSTNIKVYSNCDAVRLSINNEVIGTLRQSDLNQKTVFNWENIELPLGNVEVKAEGLDADDTVIFTDTAEWTKQTSSRVQISSDDEKISISSDIKEIQIMRTVKIGELNEGLFYSNYGSTFVLTDKDGNNIDIEANAENSITTGMKLVVTSQDSSNTEEYVFSEPSLAIGKTVTASTTRNGYSPENIVDQNFETTWLANFGATRYPQWIKLDLGKEYNLNEIGISWIGSYDYSAYKYTISVSNDDSNYTLALDKSDNSVVGKTNDAINERARYLKIDIIGNADTNDENNGEWSRDRYPSIAELQVFGWELSSDKYIVHNDNKTIYVPKEHQLPQDKFFTQLFLDNLSLEGNASIWLSSEAFYVSDGDYIEITDISGNKVTYTISFSEAPVITGSGDVDGDGHIQAKDASDVLQYVLDPIKNSVSHPENADVDRDNIITANDAAFILKAVIDSLNKVI